MKKFRFFRHRNVLDILVAVALVLTVALVWSWFYHRLDLASWSKPNLIGGDGSLVTSFMEAAAEGDFTPWQFKGPHRLGAPFKAEWNSWPITEEFLCWTSGMVARVVGLPAAINLMMMTAHVLAAVSFYWACRLLGKRRFPSAVFALLFGLSYFIFRRGLGHLTVGYCWHVPLCWAVICYAFSARGLFKNRRRAALGVGVAVITGLQNPYYTFVFGQFLGFAFLVQALKRRSWSPVLGPVVVAAVLLAAFVSMQADTLIDRIVRHRGALSAERSYLDMELYALKPMDLVLPLHWHVPFLERLMQTYNHQKAITGEFPLAFLGVVAAAGGVLLAGITFRDLLLRGGRLSESVRKYAVPTAWIGVLSVAGGLVGMGALLTGAYFLRGSNRFSVFIVALLLFFLVDVFTKATRRRSRWSQCALAAALLLASGLEFNAFRMPEDAVRGAGIVWGYYGEFLSSIEKSVGRDAMLFNLPAVDFPESPPLNREDPYAPLMLYNTRSSLRFSYGNMRGDYRDTWQRGCAHLPPEEMVAALRRYGFKGILVSCWAYPDKAKALIDSLSAVTGQPPVIIAGESFAFLSLGPLTAPEGAIQLPATANISAQTGWWPLEYREDGEALLWANGDATFALYRDPALASQVPSAISMQVSTPTARTLSLSCRGKPLLKMALRPNIEYPLELLRLPLQPGWNILHLRTDQPALCRPDVPADIRIVSLNVRAVHASGLAPGSEDPPPGTLVMVKGEIKPEAGTSFGGLNAAEVTDAAGRRWREFYTNEAPLQGLAGRPARRIEFLPNGQPFCLLVRVSPDATQEDFATISSSLTQDFHGLTLEKGPGSEPVYNCAVGEHGKFVAVGGGLSLLPGHAYLMALNVVDQDLTLQVRGDDGSNVVFTRHSPEIAELSGAYWRWGNWMLESRPFAGHIELLSMGGSLSSGEIEQLLTRHQKGGVRTETPSASP